MPHASTIQSAALLLLGSLIAGYWYRVMRMAIKARRRTGRAANLWPPEPLGRVLRFLWTPAVVVWMAHPILSAFVKTPPFFFRPVWQPGEVLAAWVACLAALAAAACFAATSVCWKRMGTSWRMGIDPAEVTPLVATGPFAYVRHPIYGLSALMMLAAAAALPTPLMLSAAVIHLSFLFWESSREERHLLQAHGAFYRDYQAHVGRFLPRSLRPYSP